MTVIKQGNAKHDISATSCQTDRPTGHRTDTVHRAGRGKVRGAILRGGKMRGTVRGINARRWVICEAGMCEAQRTTGAAGVVIGCEPLKRN